VSMDVTFQELKPYYSSEVISPFGDSLDTRGMRREEESSSDGKRRMVTVIKTRKEDSTVVEMKVEMNEFESGRTQVHGGVEI
jgi:hypothetical protein